MCLGNWDLLRIGSITLESCSQTRINLHFSTYFSIVLLREACASWVRLSTSLRTITYFTSNQCYLKIFLVLWINLMRGCRFLDQFLDDHSIMMVTIWGSHIKVIFGREDITSHTRWGCIRYLEFSFLLSNDRQFSTSLHRINWLAKHLP
jgi:hypothetical protein